MSRKKRPSSPAASVPSKVLAAPSCAEREPAPAPRPTLPPPNPPRPNKWFLGASIALLAAWLGFLLYLALHAQHAAG